LAERVSMETSAKVELLRDLLAKRGETVGFAESCTGGLLSAECAKLSGVSRVLQGSVVSYSNAVKVGILGVPESSIAAYGAVSEPVARYMARGAKKQLKCDWSVSITGIAGPTGGTPAKPVGTVCFGICGPGIEYTLIKKFEGAGQQKLSRQEVQQTSADFALDLLLAELK
jgi:nicotinamide-nucleotide amidase